MIPKPAPKALAPPWQIGYSPLTVAGKVDVLPFRWTRVTEGLSQLAKHARAILNAADSVYDNVVRV